MLRYESSGESDTFAAGRDAARLAAPGRVFCLRGGMGAGKTVFAKGFAAGMGVAETVASPTFAIVNEYSGRLPLYHFDVYRLRDSTELLGAGCEEYFYSDGVCLIEWADRIADIIPSDAVWIDITETASGRSIEVWENDGSRD
ncbi:MAG: tRNA (adenosine(37)-N6)-threonylcarbamoyltransferase complex ATPase subunit type 1 TsaE [Clostridiales bacterium]|jgi:tRNA threonylcarbamoyladenosine biosynthesis protein TsaE|nr:tRNA (adenosine(37)-N6)-threonylcarbamoyltransferase complex ATPase subunit type 1 TsaE [Clostridiales bacterium]